MSKPDKNNSDAITQDESISLEQAYRNNHDKLLKYSLFLVGDIDSSQDIIGEAFSRLADKLTQNELIKSVPDWLFMVTRNLCFDKIRERGRFVEFEGNISGPNLSLTKEQTMFVEQILGQLDIEERDLILLREVERFSIIQIAAMLNITTEAVRVRLYRVRKKMQMLGRK